MAIVCVIVASTGCSRERYRERTDKDVEAIITQKNVVPDWQVQNWHVYPDQRARFADPSCPDYPPYPPDDYATKMLSPNPQKPGRGGVGRHEGDGYLKQIEAWDAQNRSEVDPNTETKPATQTGTTFQSNDRAYRLTLDQTVELALVNSREFQDRREDLYLAALPVSLQRFQFSAQAFAANELIRQSFGAGLATTNPNENWANNSSFGFNRTFASGASLVVRLANQIVVDIGNNRPTISISTITGTLTQPFLRGGGQAVTLEALTQAERTLLYAIRSYARFRSLFYYAIAGAGDYTNNPYGLQGFAANLGRGVGANLTARSVGYLPTLLRSAILSNEQKNVVAVEQFLKLFQNLREGGNVTELQVVRVEQRLLQSRALVLRRTQENIDNLDNFKLQLGVPATLTLELDDSPLRPIRGQLGKMEEVYEHLRQFEESAFKYEANEPVGEYRQRWNRLLKESKLVAGTTVGDDWDSFSKAVKDTNNDNLVKRRAELAEQRRKALDERVKHAENSPEYQKFESQAEKIFIEMERYDFELALRNYESQPWLKLMPEKRPAEQLASFRATFDIGLLVAIEARNQRLQKLRANWPEVPAIIADDVDVLRTSLDDAYNKVSAIALNSRLDLMNARAQVVDSWRQLTVTANALQGIMNVEYDITANTPTGGSEIVNFSATRTLHQIRLRLEPPFVRRAERNAYRAALISYQRQRRNLQAFEDNIVTDTRTDLRTVRQLYQVYLVQQRAVEVAYAQVENARATLVSPPDPRSQDSSGNIAALTQQLLEAQSSLVQAQNDLYTTWINYLTARMELFLDMERLTPDDRGLWTNEASPNTRVPDGEIIAPATANPVATTNTKSAAPERLPATVGTNDPFPPLVLPGLAK